MSLTIAILLVSLIYVVALAPLVVAAVRPVAAKPLVLAYGALLSGAAGYQAGFFQDHDLPSLDTGSAGAQSAQEGQCAELLDLLESERIIVDRRSPPRLVVAPSWEQLPEEARQVAVTCVERAWPRGTGPTQINTAPR